MTTKGAEGGEARLDGERSEDPRVRFEAWLDRAIRDSGVPNPNAMTLCTIGEDGFPQARMVLLKGIDEELGFTFFTNLESAKGRALRADPRAALVFFWDHLDRQVRVVGEVVPLTSAEADRYFASRPRGSRIGAWASRQSRPLGSREELEVRVAEMEARFRSAKVIPRPPHWSGFRLLSRSIEFWEGRENRLHDRLLFEREGERWLKRGRLFP